MSDLSYNEMMKISKEFYDTIDFEEFLKDKSLLSTDISVEKLVELLENYYNSNHPELLPEQFQGCFLNFMNTEEFGNYIAERYGYRIEERVEVTYHLYQRSY